MIRIIFGIFFVLHGLVHLLYAGHSRRLFEMQEGLTWPDGSWAFTSLLGEVGTRTLATIVYVFAALAFVVAGIATVLNLAWWGTAVTGAAVFSGLAILVFWNGSLQRFSDQGGIGLLIDIAIIVAVMILQ